MKESEEKENVEKDEVKAPTSSDNSLWQRPWPWPWPWSSILGYLFCPRTRIQDYALRRRQREKTYIDTIHCIHVTLMIC